MIRPKMIGPGINANKLAMNNENPCAMDLSLGSTALIEHTKSRLENVCFHQNEKIFNVSCSMHSPEIDKNISNATGTTQ